MTSLIKVDSIQTSSGGTATASSLGITGTIGQVVQTVKTDTYSQSTTSFTDITGMSASITPSSTNSKIYVMIALNVGSRNASQAQFKLLRGSTAINVGDSAGSRQQGFAEVDGQNDYAQTPTVSNFLDSPNTTSATTYKIQMRVTGSTHYLNRSVNDTDANYETRTPSSITLMEVLA